MPFVIVMVQIVNPVARITEIIIANYYILMHKFGPINVLKSVNHDWQACPQDINAKILFLDLLIREYHRHPLSEFN